MEKFSVSIVIPAFNEEQIIEKAVKSGLKILKNTDTDYEIIIVNDGSTDKTKELIDNHFYNEEKVLIHHKNNNEGFGSAVSMGIELSSKEFILCVPADSPPYTGII